MKILLFSFSITFAAIGCNKENRCDCVKSTGAVVTETRLLQHFDTLRVFDDVNTVIDIDSTLMAVVTAGKNLLPLIQTEIINNELIIRNYNTCNWVRSYKKGGITVVVHAPEIFKIVNNSVAPVVSPDTIGNYFIWLSAENSGDIELTLNTVISYCQTLSSGDIILHGKSVRNGGWMSGTSWLRWGDLLTDDTFVESYSTGDCFVNASKSLGVIIYSTGSIYYTGTPYAIDATQYGSGKLVNNN